MKKYNLLGLIGLGCGALLLSGCFGGGENSHTLKCEQSAGGQKNVIEIEFNDEETKAQKVIMEITMDLGEDVTDEGMEQSKEQLKANCEETGYQDCKVTSSGTKLIYHFAGSAEKMGVDGSTDLKTIKEGLEEDNYSCK